MQVIEASSNASYQSEMAREAISFSEYLRHCPRALLLDVLEKSIEETTNL
jgi:hypothetical protein